MVPTSPAFRLLLICWRSKCCISPFRKTVSQRGKMVYYLLSYALLIKLLANFWLTNCYCWGQCRNKTAWVQAAVCTEEISPPSIFIEIFYLTKAARALVYVIRSKGSSAGLDTSWGKGDLCPLGIKFNIGKPAHRALHTFKTQQVEKLHKKLYLSNGISHGRIGNFKVKDKRGSQT